MKRLIQFILVAIIISACGIITPLTNSKSKLFDLKVRMTQDEVKTKFSNPDEIRGSMINEEGQTVTVWQYKLFNPSTAYVNFFTGPLLLTINWWVPLPKQGDLYWFYFVEDKLAQWGQAGDWREDIIMRIKIDK